MDETYEQLERLRAGGGRVAMATLVATRGTTPKREGAKMWVAPGGEVIGSVTIGGCVDARVIEEAEQVLAGSAPRLVSMVLGDEDAWELGLTCGGTVQVLVEPVDFGRHDDAAARCYDVVRQEVDGGRRVALVTPLAGDTRRLVVRDDGTVVGTLGDAALDERARVRAAALLADGTSRTIVVEGASGELEAFCEVHAPRPTLVVFGGGNVAVPLVELARTLGWRTVVVDGRARFASRERFPHADEIRVGMPSEIAESLAYDASTYVVLVAHDYKYDVPVLRAVLRAEPAYVGMLGSRRRGRAILDFLAAEGVSADRLGRVRVPIGLDIGARTAPEIALSILAEALAVRAARTAEPMARRAGP